METPQFLNYRISLYLFFTLFDPLYHHRLLTSLFNQDEIYLYREGSRTEYMHLNCLHYLAVSELRALYPF